MNVNVKEFRPAFYKPDEALAVSERKCLKCPTMLHAGLKFYCSGFCMNQAKTDGSYGHELNA